MHHKLIIMKKYKLHKEKKKKCKHAGWQDWTLKSTLTRKGTRGCQALVESLMLQFPPPPRKVGVLD